MAGSQGRVLYDLTTALWQLLARLSCVAVALSSLATAVRTRTTILDLSRPPFDRLGWTLACRSTWERCGSATSLMPGTITARWASFDTHASTGPEAAAHRLRMLSTMACW